MLPEYSRLPLARTLFALLQGTVLTYDALDVAVDVYHAQSQLRLDQFSATQARRTITVLNTVRMVTAR